MYNELLNIHSYFRYLVLLMLVLALVNYVLSYFVNDSKPFNRLFTRYAFVAFSIQGILGIILYFISPFVKFTSGMMSDKDSRYWTMEHGLMMIIALILVMIGQKKFGTIKNSKDRTRTTFILYGIGLLIVIATLALSDRGIL